MESTQTNQNTTLPLKSKKGDKPKKPKKKQKWVRTLIIVVVAVVIVALVIYLISSTAGTAVSGLYITETAQRRDIVVGVSSTGTVKPIDSYQVTALVKGEVLEAPFEEGQVVEKDSVLYRIDASDVENTISRSQVALEQARVSYNELLKNKADMTNNYQIKANGTGIVKKLYYEQGDTVTAGTPIADILDRQNMTIELPFHSSDVATFYVGQAATVTVDGTLETIPGVIDEIAVVDQVGAGGTMVRNVTIKITNPGAVDETTRGTASVGTASCASGNTFTYGANKQVVATMGGKLISQSVKEGDYVTDRQVIGSYEVTDIDSQIENARLAIQNAELTLQSAQDQLDNYTIKAPISGTIIEKNYKVGDNVDPSTAGTSGASLYMAVIYDMSTLTFDMNIDELDIGKVSIGQEVTITADAVENQTFTGYVDNININGTTLNGTTNYPVTVVINDPGEDLFPGMNVSADIVSSTVRDAISLPVDAVSRDQTVLVALDGALDANGNLTNGSKTETRKISIGKSDSQYVEITDGLEEGEIVLIETEASDMFSNIAIGGAAG